MISPEALYVATVIVLLLFALAVGLPVLKRVFVEGLERRRKLQSGEIERYTDDEDDPDPSTTLEAESTERSRLACRHCGVANEPGFRYCRACGEPL